MRAASIGIACEESFAITMSLTPVDEQVLAVDAHAEERAVPCRRARTTCCDSASAARGSKAPCRPPPRPPGRLARRLVQESGACLEQPLPDARQVAQRHAHAAGGARRAQPIDGDVGAALRAGLLPDQLAHQVGVARARWRARSPSRADRCSAIRSGSGRRAGRSFPSACDRRTSGPKAPRPARADSSRSPCGTRRSVRRSRGSSRPRRCRRACRAGGGWSRRGTRCRASSGTRSVTCARRPDPQLADEQAEHRLRHRHEDVRRLVGHAVGVALEHQPAAMQDGDAVGVGLAQERLELDPEQSTGCRAAAGARAPDRWRCRRDGHELAHMVECPAVERRGAPVGERDLHLESAS